MTPRWTYTEANATRWKPLFDALIGGQSVVEIPLADNGKTLTSLKIRVGDALKWLADQYRNAQVEAFKPYAELKRRVRYAVGNNALVVKCRPSVVFQVPTSETTQATTAPKMSPDAIKRMVAMMRDEQRPIERRQVIAAVLFRELSAQRQDEELSVVGLPVEEVLLETAAFLTVSPATIQQQTA